MKKLLFFSSFNVSGERLQYDGVTKKIKLEIDTFTNFKFAVDYIVQIDGIIYLQKAFGEKVKLLESSGKYYKDFEYIYLKLIKHIDELNYDCMYMRFEGATYNMMSFLRSLKRRNPKINIIGEKPTYHTKWEPGSSLTAKIKFIIRFILNNLFSREFDKIVTFDNRNFIFGRPTLKIENFADVKNLPIKKIQHSNDEIHLLAIAQLTPSHGFDRVIKGLGEYYKFGIPNGRKVFLHVIGDGRVKSEWEKLALSLGLSEYVFFEGSKTTEEITQYVNKSHLAVACLAIFRKNCLKASELKIREYCARAIPFIYSSDEPILVNQKWCMKVSHDEVPIDIHGVLKFIDSLDYNKVQKDMRDFAYKYCTPEVQLNKVIHDLK